MKWSTDRPVFGEWYECFAWFPKRIREAKEGKRVWSEWAWLERVECKAKPGMRGSHFYDYRPLGDTGEGV